MGAAERTYDQRNQVETITEKLRGVAKNTATYRYNENGAPDRLEHDGAISEFVYDERDLLSVVRNATNSADPAARFTRYTYTPREQRATETRSNGNVVTYDYFLDGLLRHSLEKKANDTVVAEHTLEYQENLQKSRDQFKLQSGDNSSFYLEGVNSYLYDPRDRVFRVEDPTGANPGNERYFYDANSNVIAQRIGTPPGEDTTQFFYDRNRLVRTTDLTGEGGTTYNYDAAGRVSTVVAGEDLIERYVYDAFDHVLEHDQRGADDVMRKAKYAYDALGRTSAMTDHTGKATVYSYLGLTGEVLDEQVGDVTTRSFEYSALNERLLQARLADDPGRGLYGYNTHGDVETLTSEGGDSLTTHGYSVYGVAFKHMTTGKDRIDPQNPYKEPYNPYWFNARRFGQIAPTGADDFQPASYRMGQRDYQPLSHRYLTPDAGIGAQADLGLSLNPATSNRYGFAGGTPASNVQYMAPVDWKRVLITLGVSIGVAAGIALLEGPVCAATVGFGCALGFAIAAGALGAAAGYTADVLMDPNPSFDPGEFAQEAFVGGLFGLATFGLGGGFGRLGGRAVRGSRFSRELSCNSFSADTPVLMADGTHKPIKDVKVGDKVLATNPETGRTEAKPVTDVITGSGQKQLVEITVDTDGTKGNATGTITATAEHPFWVAGGTRWTDAEDLEVGDRLRTPRGATVVVVAVRRWAERREVHNLTVESLHTYYVGAGASNVLVHNAFCLSEVPDAPGIYEIYFLVNGKLSVYVGSTPKGGTMRDRVAAAFKSRKGLRQHAVQKAGLTPDDVLFVATIEAPRMGKYEMILAEQQRIHFHRLLGRTLVNRTNASGPSAWRKFFDLGMS